MGALDVRRRLEAPYLPPSDDFAVVEVPDLKRTRERGYGIHDIENEEGTRCAGAPVLTDDLHPVGAISVSGRVDRLGDRRLSEIASRVVEAADAVSVELGYRAGRSA